MQNTNNLVKWLLKGLDTHGVKVASVLTATLKASDGMSSNYVLVADETHLYIIQHGTVVLVLSTPDTITPVRNGLVFVFVVDCVAINFNTEKMAYCKSFWI